MQKVLDSTQSYTFSQIFDLRISADDLDPLMRILERALNDDPQISMIAPTQT
jgi:hypothetical protein